MLQAKDLQIGDWYAFRGHPYQCTASDIASLAECEKQGAPTDISEIPITEEILEKNFEKKTFYGIYDDYFDLSIREYSDSIYVVTFHNCDASFPDQIVTLCFVHELQHFLHHCGIEKEIML